MSKRITIALMVLAIASVATMTVWWWHSALAPARTAAGPSPVSTPNIVLIIADDIGYGDYSFAGHPVLQTPNIDRLARDGVLFRNGYSTNAICRPSLASILTGLYPHQHGIAVNARALNARRDPAATPSQLPTYTLRMQSLDTLPRTLSRLGYTSYQAGKWWEEGFENGGFTAGDKKPEGDSPFVTRKNVIGREGMQPVFDFIDAQREQPFFLWYAPQMPHTPHNPPEKFLAPYREKTNDPQLANYWGTVSWFDDTVGQLLAHLEARGLLNNTLVIYLADNGIASDTDAGEGSGKDSPYESGVRTPIIFHWPRHWPATQRHELVSSIDLAPTLLDLLQQPIGPLPGRTLLPTLQAQAPLARGAVFGEGYEDSGQERFDLARKFRWLRADEGDHAWKLIVHGDRRVELFDLQQDAGEQHNLAERPEHQPIRQRLLQQLDNELP